MEVTLKKTDDNLNNKNDELTIHYIKDLVKLDFYSSCWIVNKFCLFTSIEENTVIIYADNAQKILISYDLKSEQIIHKIKNPHNCEEITNIRHYLYVKKNQDLFLTISGYKCKIKIWNFKNVECILNLTEIYDYLKSMIYSACFLEDKTNIYIITSFNLGCDKLKVFDLEGNFIKEVNDEKKETNNFFIDIYKDKKSSKDYIITTNKGYSKSFDYNSNKLYKKYINEKGKEFEQMHMHMVIDDKEDIIKLIESCNESILIWDFHSANLLKIVNINNGWLYYIGFWEKNIFYVGGRNGDIFFVDIKESKIVKNLKSHRDKVLTIKKIYHPKYGLCLISQDLYNIKLWAN